MKPLHPLAQSLLREFKDVFPNDLPSRLHPFRGIELPIDLLLHAPLPNKSACRCDPNESKELQQQVQELLNRRYIRKSLSPCLVPALLVPKKVGTWSMFVDS